MLARIELLFALRVFKSLIFWGTHVGQENRKKDKRNRGGHPRASSTTPCASYLESKKANLTEMNFKFTRPQSGRRGT